MLVVVSYCVAVLASYTALDLGGHLASFEAGSNRRRLWLGAGALAMGTGIWSMHFIGMKAFTLPIKVSYDLGLTILSWCAAVWVSLLALYIIGRGRLTLLNLVVGSAVMGAGISIMHYSGMWAMRMTPGITYDPMLLGSSLLIAVVASGAALFICVSVRRLPAELVLPVKVGAALVMGAAICGMHYTGMAAARFSAGAVCGAGNLLAGNWMGYPVALGTIGVLCITLMLAVSDAKAEREREARKRAEEERTHRMAFYDAATELPNRSLLNQCLLKHLVTDGGRTPAPFGLLYAEMRNYRALLLSLGQERINDQLRSLAAELSSILREGDMLARLSHDSFMFLLSGHPDRPIEKAIAACSEHLARLQQGGGDAALLGWNLGFSLYPQHGASTQALLRSAMKPQRILGESGVEAAVRPGSVAAPA
jgi:NO-binding membrane sensor protein with MHYT domain/GGDEF domain-containing protein